MVPRRRERFYGWLQLNADRWGTRLFLTGLVLMGSPLITVLFAAPMVIATIMYTGAVMAALGMMLGLVEWRR